MKPMSAHANDVYKRMLANAYRKSGGPHYTTADLLKEINHNLNTDEMRRVGRKFSSYIKKRPGNFMIVGQKGNNYIYRTV